MTSRDRVWNKAGEAVNFHGSIRCLAGIDDDIKLFTKASGCVV